MALYSAHNESQNEIVPCIPADKAQGGCWRGRHTDYAVPGIGMNRKAYYFPSVLVPSMKLLTPEVVHPPLRPCESCPILRFTLNSPAYVVFWRTYTRNVNS